MRRLLVLVVVLATGCSLPLPRDVREVGEITGEQRAGGTLAVIPPGPRLDATPVQTVLGFLGAQASSADSHAVARLFLTSSTSDAWDDDAEVQVYDPDRLQVTALNAEVAGQQVVRVTARVSGVVRSDGSYEVRPDVPVVEDYRLERVQDQWRLASVPTGLRLTQADLLRAFRPRPVYYLAPTTTNDSTRLVPDLIFLPTTGNLADALVRRLLQAPSAALAGAVSTAVPAGARLRDRVSVSGSGVVTVDLTGVQTLSGAGLQDLSAQLVWTLRSLGASFRSLRLQLDGQPITVDNGSSLQDARGFEAYDPDGVGPVPPYVFSSSRRLRASTELPPTSATAGDVGDGSAVPVDLAALTIDRTTVALLDTSNPRRVVVRVGPLRGSALPVVATGPQLSSPTWGSGEHGLWLVREGREVVRVQDGLKVVPIIGRPPGAITSLAVSRGGVRVAIAIAGTLYVGRIELGPTGPRIVGLTAILPTVRDVQQVVWRSSTELIVLGTRVRSRQLLRVAVDGSSALTLNTAGLTVTAVAASPIGAVVVSDNQLYLSTGGPFRLVQAERATAPAFPG